MLKEAFLQIEIKMFLFFCRYQKMIPAIVTSVITFPWITWPTRQRLADIFQVKKTLNFGVFDLHSKGNMNQIPFHLCSCVWSQAPWRRGLFFLSADPVFLHPALTTTLACGTPSKTTLAKNSLKWRCLCNLTSRSTPCRGCVRSWSTASCWTRPLTHRTLSNVWWGGFLLWLAVWLLKLVFSFGLG